MRPCGAWFVLANSCFTPPLAVDYVVWWDKQKLIGISKPTGSIGFSVMTHANSSILIVLLICVASAKTTNGMQFDRIFRVCSKSHLFITCSIPFLVLTDGLKTTIALLAAVHCVSHSNVFLSLFVLSQNTAKLFNAIWLFTEIEYRNGKPANWRPIKRIDQSAAKSWQHWSNRRDWWGDK